MIAKNTFTFLAVFLPIFIGCIGTFYLKLSFSAVYASCIASLLLIALNRVTLKTSKNDALIFCGSFISMGNIASEFILLLASIISALAFIGLQDKLLGFGGKLGTVAFIGCFMSLILGLF
jgi:hypothetical protein